MQKIYGAPGPQNGLYKIGTKKWELFYGFGKDNEEDETGWNYRERFDHRPTLDEIKETIVAQIKEESDLNLRYGFKWNGMTVKYSEALKSDLTGILVALQGGLMQFPIEVNLGSSADSTPTIYSFTSMEELAVVAMGIANHRSEVSKTEWAAILALGELDEYKTEQ